ncbi:MAG: U32 family peptidase [Candidatus Magnetomorum sp.]|nr:U32 family peptidase [Candidatus Magnetomorum sp.]
MHLTTTDNHQPKILAPAGDRQSFLAAIAAGADAVYCGLKSFSARMEAKNFSVEELASLTALAHQKNIAVYVALNSMVRQSELSGLEQWLYDVVYTIQPDALIIQDLAFVSLARTIGYPGELHLSTLANVSFPEALQWIQKKLPVNRVVLPRELSIDEIKLMAHACPNKLKLEVFVHGALCYGVSGRCYWSSFLGGKSGLRGRCVQPCRRLYNYKNHKKRFFSCADFCLEVLVKTFRPIAEISAWKIEGRKKGPHYVYHTTKAYKILRDHGFEPGGKKEALSLLEYALGRDTTHYQFLPQRPFHPISTEMDTGSGYKIARIAGKESQRYFVIQEALFPGDRLRIGYEDQPGHHIQNITKSIPKRGRWVIQKPRSGTLPVIGSPVFLIDRKDPALMEKIEGLQQDVGPFTNETPSYFKPKEKKVSRARSKGVYQNPIDLTVLRHVDNLKTRRQTGIWLSRQNVENIPKKFVSHIWWWLPPVIWPEHEKQWYQSISNVLQMGAKYFVVNAPWQVALLDNPQTLQVWAGPFCNISNTLGIAMLKKHHFSGVIISPELGKEDILSLPDDSPLPVGIVVSGLWPLTLSRIPPAEIRPNQPFISPKGEASWYANYDDHLHWIFPNWPIDITRYKNELIKAGYTLFAHLIEPVPKTIEIKARPGIWNWELNV